MADRYRRPVIFRTDGGRVLVRLAFSQCEVDRAGLDISMDADMTPAVVAALFAVLRLTRVTDWQWAAVTAPLWGLVLLTAASAGIALTVAALRRPGSGSGA